MVDFGYGDRYVTIKIDSLCVLCHSLANSLSFVLTMRDLRRRHRHGKFSASASPPLMNGNRKSGVYRSTGHRCTSKVLWDPMPDGC